MSVHMCMRVCFEFVCICERGACVCVYVCMLCICGSGYYLWFCVLCIGVCVCVCGSAGASVFVSAYVAPVIATAFTYACVYYYESARHAVWKLEAQTLSAPEKEEGDKSPPASSLTSRQPWTISSRTIATSVEARTGAEASRRERVDCAPPSR